MKIILFAKSSSKREVYSDISLHHETKKISNEQSNLIPKATREKNKQNPKLVEEFISLREENKWSRH